MNTLIATAADATLDLMASPSLLGEVEMRPLVITSLTYAVSKTAFRSEGMVSGRYPKSDGAPKFEHLRLATEHLPYGKKGRRALRGGRH